MVSHDHSSALKGLLSEPAPPKNSTSKWSRYLWQHRLHSPWFGEQQSAHNVTPAEPQNFCTFSLLSIGFCVSSCLDTLHRCFCTNLALKSLYFKILANLFLKQSHKNQEKEVNSVLKRTGRKAAEWDKKVHFLVWLISYGSSFFKQQLSITSQVSRKREIWIMSDFSIEKSPTHEKYSTVPMSVIRRNQQQISYNN